MSPSVDVFQGERSAAYSPRAVVRALRQERRGSVRPNRSLLVCTNPRSGSWMLCTALARCGLAGYPSEYLIPWDAPDWARVWGTAGAEEFLAAMLDEGASANGVFAAKLMYGHLGHLLDLAGQVPGGERVTEVSLLPTVFPEPRYVWLRRRDRLRQAVSHARAIHSGVWAVNERDAGEAVAPACDVDLVRRLLAEATEQDEGWGRLFDAMGAEPLELWYEDLVADLPAALADVLGHVGVTEDVDPDVARPDVVPQADEVTEHWVEICRAALMPGSDT
jgi:trehalose 2-sulfotransferase